MTSTLEHVSTWVEKEGGGGDLSGVENELKHSNGPKWGIKG